MSKKTGFLVGALVGAAAALFLAPKKGSELREGAGKIYDDLKENPQETLTGMRDTALDFSAEKFNEIKEKFDSGEISADKAKEFLLSKRDLIMEKVDSGELSKDSVVDFFNDTKDAVVEKINSMKDSGEELFDEKGRLIPELAELAPKGDARLGANPHANGGLLLKDLRLPDFRSYGIEVEPGKTKAQDMIELGGYIRDIFKLNEDSKNFRIFGPDESMSNRLYKVFEEQKRDWQADLLDTDDCLARDGRIMDGMLSEHMCEGWLEGYLLTGRHGFFASYEAFIRIVDSMAAQHAKWLKVCNQLSWRQPIASLNFILTSNVWQQDHNGFTHQDPGFLDHIANKKADVVRMYLPPDTNCLLSCFDHCIKSKNYVNAIVASKHPSCQWLTMEQAVKHCTQGIGIWEWASNDCGEEPDVVMACCGDTPTLEVMAAVTILRDEMPELKIRVVNVVDLFKLESDHKHPHGLSDAEYDAIFTKDKPVIFAFHGYPTLIHELTYERHNHNISVHGYQEEGTITTPFDMRVQNQIDRFNLVKDAIMHLPQLGNKGSFLIQKMNDKLVEHKQYIAEYGQDLEEIRNWEWHK